MTISVDGAIAGPETKVMLNNGGCRHKRSSLEKSMNTAVLWCVAVLILMCFLSACGSGIWQVCLTLNYIMNVKKLTLAN